MSTLLETLEGFKGLSHPEALTRWRDGYKASNTTSGVDVLLIGDSILHGSGATDRWIEGFAHQLKLRLQNALNPSGVVGGWGFVPASDGSAVYGSGTTGSNLFIISNNAGSGTAIYSDDVDGCGDRSFTFHNAGTDTYNWLAYNYDQSATTVAYHREKISEIEVCYKADAAYGTMNIDVSTSTGATPARTAGSPTLALDQSVVSGGTWGMRSSAMTVSNIQAAMRIAIRPPATSSTVVSLDGIILYNGDYRAGVRVHTLANPGSRLESWSDNTLAATIAPFCTMASGGGARNGKLVIISDVINSAQSVGAGGSVTATIKARWKEILEYIAAQPSLPTIMIMFPPKIVIGASIASYVTDDNWDEMLNGWRQVVDETNTKYGQKVACIVDCNQIPGLNQADQTDEVHNTSSQQAQMAEAFASVIIRAAQAD